MKKLIVILLILTGFSINAQTAHYRALHLILQNVDTTFFDEEGYRWYEFSMPNLRAFKIMNLIEEGGTSEFCLQIKSLKEYKRYIKYNNQKLNKFDRKVFAYLDCNVGEHVITMWMTDDISYGFVTISTDFE